MNCFWDLVLRVPESLTIDDQKLIQSFYQEKGREYTIKEAQKRKVVPFVACALIKAQCDISYWNNEYIGFLRRNKTIINLLNDVFLAFDRFDCKTPCVSENFAALLTSNRLLGCFSSGDVDISAAPEEKERIDSAMLSLGFEKTVRKKYRKQLDQEEYVIPKQYKICFYINLVWRPVMRERGWTINQKTVNNWLCGQRKDYCCYLGSRIRLLNPEATLLHCIYHISAGHYYSASPGTKLLSEIDRILRYCQIDWQKLQVYTKTAKLRNRVFVSLLLTRKVLNSDIEENRINEFHPSHKVLLICLCNNLYKEKKGIKVLKEPNGLLNRLLIDVLSEDGSLLFALVKKTVDFCSWDKKQNDKTGI